MLTATQSSFFRQFFGEDLGRLGLEELEQLERQLGSSLGQVRSLKVTISSFDS